MMQRLIKIPVLASAILGSCLAVALLSGCDQPGSGESGGEQSDQSGSGGDSMMASPLGTPKDVIAQQYVLLRNGQVEELKVLFAESLREEITPELVEELRENIPPVSLNDLVNEVVPEEGSDSEVFIIKRKDGTILTRLTKTDKGFEADTLWFEQLKK
jgi:hypothetical protein